MAADTVSDDVIELKDDIYDLIRIVKDPEKPVSLEDLGVVSEEGIKIEEVKNLQAYLINIEFVPTVTHCSLATLIGLCLRVKLERGLPPERRYKLHITVREGSHETSDAVNKQINDKERVAAALENPNLLELVNECVQDDW